MITADDGGKRGFTLVELMVVVAIVALALAMALPSVFRKRPQYYADAAARQLAADIREARVRSMASGCTTMLQINASRTGYTLWTDLNGNGQTNDLEAVTAAFETSGTLTCNAYPSRQGIFYPDGTFSSAAYSDWIMWVLFSIPSEGMQRWILIWPSGQVTLHKVSP